MDYEILKTPKVLGTHYALVYGKWSKVKVETLFGDRTTGAMIYDDSRCALSMSDAFIKTSKKPVLTLIETYRLTKDHWVGQEILKNILKDDNWIKKL